MIQNAAGNTDLDKIVQIKKKFKYRPTVFPGLKLKAPCDKNLGTGDAFI